MEDKKERLKHAILDKLNEKCSHPKECSLCGKREWAINEGIFEMREFSYSLKLRLQEGLIPLISIMCNNCGNMLLVNPIALGVDKEFLLLEEKPKEEEVKK
jgi:hypothetical protein